MIAPRLFPVLSRPITLLVTMMVMAAAGQEETATDDRTPAAPESADVPYARRIRVSLPLTGNADNRIKQRIRRVLEETPEGAARPILVLHFLPTQTEFGEGSDFSRARSLSEFLTSRELSGVHTVAFVPQTIRGHAVLPILACEEIVMAPDASFGEAGIDINDDDGVGLDVLSDYRRIAERRKTIPVEIAISMVKKDLKVLMAETEENVEYVFEHDLAELQENHVLRGPPQVLVDRGELGRLTGRRARELGFVKYLVEQPAALARALGLDPRALDEDPSLDGKWVPIRVPITGTIQGNVSDQIPKLIARQIETGGVNFVCLWLDSPGGSPEDSVVLATYLASLDPAEVRTVAYIPREARADAALIALACDHIIMRSDAVLGGYGAEDIEADEAQALASTYRESIAKPKQRTWSLGAAMIDPSLEVYRCRRAESKLIQYFSDAELREIEKEQPQDAPGWEKVAAVSQAGEVLRLTGENALEYRVARHLVADFGELKQHYGLEGDPALVEPSWAETFVDALASPGLAWLLLMVGGASLYAELQNPGIGIGAFLATVCFVLFFWSRYLDGTAAGLEILLFIVGLVFVVLELFVLPGFGIFGLGGGILVISSFVLASQTFILPQNPYQLDQFRNSLMTVGGAGVGTLVAVGLIRKYLPHAPLFGQMFLSPPSTDERKIISQREMLVDYSHLMGQSGVAVTRIMPSGKAQFEDQILDVTTNGEALARGDSVEVVEVHGNRVLVRQTNRNG